MAGESYANAVSQLYQQRGDILAQRGLQKAQIIGGTLSALAQIPAQHEARKRQQRMDEAAAREAEARAQERAQESQLKGLQIGRLTREDQADAALREAIRTSASPYEAVQKLAQLDPEKAQALAAKNADQVARLVQQARPQTWHAIRPAIEKLAGPQDENALPLEYPGDEWKRQTILDHADAKTYLSETKPPEPQKPVPIKTVRDGQAGTVYDVPEPGAFYPEPTTPTDRNPTEASLALAAAAGDKDAAQALRLLRQQNASGVGQERLVQIMGPNGTPIWVRESQAVGQPAAQAARAVTGAERQSLAFYNRAKGAVDTLTEGEAGTSLEEQVSTRGLGTQLGLQYAPNILQSSEMQAYRQAQRAFTEARLRKESGAAIPTAEYENDARTYFAQPGDTKETIKKKRAARQIVLDGLKFSSGRAYDEYYGEPNTSPARQEKTATPKVGDMKTFPNGRKGKWDGQGWELVP